MILGVQGVPPACWLACGCLPAAADPVLTGWPLLIASCVQEAADLMMECLSLEPSQRPTVRPLHGLPWGSTSVLSCYTPCLLGPIGHGQDQGQATELLTRGASSFCVAGVSP